MGHVLPVAGPITRRSVDTGGGARDGGEHNLIAITPTDVANTITTREGARQDPSTETYVIQEPLSGLTGQRGLGIDQGDTMYTLNANNPHGIAVIPFDETQVTSGENRSRCAPGDPSPTLAKTARPPSIAFHMIQDPITEEEASPALGRKSSGMGVHGGGAQVRRLTALECERLMGNPDEYTNIPGAKDGPRYAALGNSIAVPCLTWIFRRLAFVDGLVRSR